MKERSVKVRIITPLGSDNKHALDELRYTCTVEIFNISLPIIFLYVDKNQFILANLKPDNFSLSSNEDKAIFSDDQNLCEIIYFVLCGRANENYNSIIKREMDLATAK